MRNPNYKAFLKYTENHEDEIVEEIADFLKKHYADTYQTDLYCYPSEDGKSAEFDYFVNVGGNSWLNDDHIVVCCHKENYNIREELYEFVSSPEWFQEQYPDKPFNTVDDDGDRMDDWDIVRGIVDEYHDELLEDIIDCIECNNFVEMAIGIVEQAVEETERMIENN